MVKKVPDYIFVFLVSLTLVIVIIMSAGCSTGTSQTTSQPASSGATSNQPPSGQANQQGRTARNPNFINNLLAKVADKLGVSVDAVTQAYQSARATTIPPSPPSVPSQNGQSVTPPGQGSPGHSSSSENRTASRAALFNKMSVSLNIPADQISAAWQAAMTELRASNGSTGSTH
ncbi:MAG: hypothetical protein ABSG90_10355 [Dehalococcoidia bacterium]